MTTQIEPVASLVGIVSPDIKSVYSRAAELAKEAQKVIDAQTDGKTKDNPFYVVIRGKRHPKYEAWQLIGVPLGLFAKTKWTKPLPDGLGYEAEAVIVTTQGVEISGAIASCSRDEERWDEDSGKDDHALESMAQTRACSKAYGNVLRWVFQMAGYATTPAEEMSDGKRTKPGDSPVENARKQAAQKPEAKKPEPAPAASGEASSPQVRQQLFGMLAVVGYKTDEDKKKAFTRFLPGFESSKQVPDADLVALTDALRNVKDKRWTLKVNEQGEDEIVDENSRLVYPKSLKAQETKEPF